MSEGKLTEPAWAMLERIAGGDDKYVSATSQPTRALLGAGFVESYKQPDGIFVWTRYRATPAGRAALASRERTGMP